MSKNLMWASLIHLSTHMWDDETSAPKAVYLDPLYTENNDTDIEVWDNVMNYLTELKFNTVMIDVGDAVKYERRPEISAPDAWDKDFLKKKLDEIRALGMTPIPKLNFSTCHDTWLKKYRRLVSTPEYYGACADTIQEVAELFGNPEYFHIGFDEEIAKYQNNLDMCIVRNTDLWWNDLNFIAKECEKWGARPWIWSDYYWHHKDIFAERMSKDILQSNWFYGTFKEYTAEEKANCFEYRSVDAYEEIDKLGFDQVPTSSTWIWEWNTYQTVAHGKAKLSADKVKGYMTAPWIFTNKFSENRIKDDAYKLYHARAKFYPETL